MAIDPDHMEPIYREIKCKECVHFKPCPCDKDCGYGICLDEEMREPDEFVYGEDVICSIDVTYGG